MSPIKLKICCPKTIDGKKIKKVLKEHLKIGYGFTLTLGTIIDAIKHWCKNISWLAEIDGYFVKSNSDTALYSNVASCTNIIVQNDLFYGTNGWMGTNKFYQQFTLKQSSHNLDQLGSLGDLKCGGLPDLNKKIRITLSLSLSLPSDKVREPVPPSPARPVSNQKPFMIFIKTLMGKTITLHAVTSDTTSAELKQMIENNEHISADQQRLVYAGKQIEDCDTIGSMNIQREATIHLISRAQGRTQSIAASEVNYCSTIIDFNARVDENESALAEQIQINFANNGKEKSLIALWVHPKCKIDTVQKIVRLECDHKYFGRLSRAERRDIANLAPMLSREALSRLCLEMSN